MPVSEVCFQDVKLTERYLDQSVHSANALVGTCRMGPITTSGRTTVVANTTHSYLAADFFSCILRFWQVSSILARLKRSVVSRLKVHQLGPNARDAVVDSKLRVHGVKRLRIVPEIRGLDSTIYKIRHIDFSDGFQQRFRNIYILAFVSNILYRTL